MRPRPTLSASVPFAALLTALALAALAPAARATSLLPRSSMQRLGLQPFWELHLALPPGESVSRASVLDDNLYLLTTANRVFAIHSMTGIVRWSRIIADAGQMVRGPSHNADYAFFSTGGSVAALSRRNGDGAGNPREFKGVVVHVRNDSATINLGTSHGIRARDVVLVYRPNEVGEVDGPPIAELHVETVLDRSARGRLQRLASTEKARSGDHVQANVTLPLDQIKLPFAASCAALADADRIYVGAANQRFYSLDLREGFTHWQIMTPGTVTGTPVQDAENLYFADQEGRVVCCTKLDRQPVWTFQTEGAVFAELVLTADYVFVASSDRSIYCLDRKTGRRKWRQRFDEPLMAAPVFSGGRIYQSDPDKELHVLDAATGEVLWRRAEGGKFLDQFGPDAYLFSSNQPSQLLRADPATGRVRDLADLSAVEFAVADRGRQAVLLISGDGEILCLRPEGAPRLRPEELAGVLRDDAKFAVGEKIAAQREAERAARATPLVPEAPADDLSLLFEQDWLSSRSTAMPVGGRGLVSVPGETPPPAPKPAETRPPSARPDEDEAAGEEDADEEDVTEETDEADDDEADEADDEDEAGEDEDADAADEEAGDEEDTADEGSDEEFEDDDIWDDDDEGGDSEDDETPDEE